jgi:hypothetical protein
LLDTANMRNSCPCSTFVFVVSLLCFARAQEQQRNDEQQNHGIVAGYLPDYRSYINLNATASHLTDLILFSLQPHPRGTVDGCCLNSDHYAMGRQAKSLSPSLNLWVTIGGAGRSDAIPTIVQAPIKRNQLIEGVLRLA